MLAVENVIDIIPPADFYGIDLIEIEIRCRLLNVFNRKVALIFLTGICSKNTFGTYFERSFIAVILHLL